MLPKGFTTIRSRLKQAVRSNGKYVYYFAPDRYVFSNGIVALDLTPVMAPEVRSLVHHDLDAMGRSRDSQLTLPDFMSKWETRLSLDVSDSGVRYVLPEQELAFMASDAASHVVAIQAQYLALAELIYGRRLKYKADRTDPAWPIGIYRNGTFVGAIAPFQCNPDIAQRLRQIGQMLNEAAGDEGARRHD